MKKISVMLILGAFAVLALFLTFTVEGKAH